jgi:chemotaxis protein MotB
LLASGIEKQRLKASGFADSKPKADIEDASLSEQREANRRVVVSIRRY